MKFNYKIIAMLVGMFFLRNVFAKETITWLIVDIPPFEIITNKPNSGLAGEARKLIEKKLSEYNHRTVVVNYARMMFEFKNGNYCTMSLFLTEERKKFIYFSKVPDFSFLSIGVAMREETFKQLKYPEKISVEQLVKEDQNYTLGLAHGRNYPPEVRTILNKYKSQPNITFYAQSTIDKSLFAMLMNDRIDYMLIYAHVANYMSMKSNYENRHVFVTIKEVNTYNQTYTACSKNEWGRQIIKKINQALVELRPTPEYRQLYLDWLGKNQIPHYKKHYDDFFLKLNRNDNEW